MQQKCEELERLSSKKRFRDDYQPHCERCGIELIKETGVLKIPKREPQVANAPQGDINLDAIRDKENQMIAANR